MDMSWKAHMFWYVTELAIALAVGAGMSALYTRAWLAHIARKVAGPLGSAFS